MRLVDLARALAPDLPQHIVGIRAGEKLHEVMIPEDEARATLETDDRYIVAPAFTGFDPAPYLPAGPRPVPEDFRYGSDSHREWLAIGREQGRDRVCQYV